MARLQHVRQANHGTYTEIEKEKELMDLTVNSKQVVIHFFHKDFRRCAIMDKHLQVRLFFLNVRQCYRLTLGCLPPPFLRNLRASILKQTLSKLTSRTRRFSLRN